MVRYYLIFKKDGLLQFGDDENKKVVSFYVEDGVWSAEIKDAIFFRDKDKAQMIIDEIIEYGGVAHLKELEFESNM